MPKIKTQPKLVKKYTQNITLLVHLAKGRKLTRLHAMAMFHVANLTARISDLRTLGLFNGFTVYGETKTDPTGASYEEYSMTRESRVNAGHYLNSLKRRAA
jgi:hypothetical protein